MKLIFVGVVLFLILLTSGCSFVQLQNSPPVTADSPAPTPAVPIDPNWTPPVIQQAQLQPDLATLVQKVKPSVVSINVILTSVNVFGQSFNQEGAGSGWIIDSSGLIVTNNHVVAGAKSIEVTLNDGRVFTSSQVATDPITDLAVVKIDQTGLPVVTLGDSSRMQVGMMVAAIGNALGQGLSMTAGWVSRLGASITISSGSRPLYDLIETSTPINPGNSGGPLVNMSSEVIGITNAKLVASGVSNVGYAISINKALPIIQQLIRTGRVVRPYIGVALQTMDAGLAQLHSLSVNSGALITNVYSGSPAASAGLQPGDVIVEISSNAVTSASQAEDLTQSAQIGQTMTIKYWRGNQPYTIQVTPIQDPNS